MEKKKTSHQKPVFCRCSDCKKKNPETGYGRITLHERYRHRERERKRQAESRPPLLQVRNSLRTRSLENNEGSGAGLEEDNAGNGNEQLETVQDLVRRSDSQHLLLEIPSPRPTFSPALSLRTSSRSSNGSNGSPRHSTAGRHSVSRVASIPSPRPTLSPALSLRTSSSSSNISARSSRLPTTAGRRSASRMASRTSSRTSALRQSTLDPPTPQMLSRSPSPIFLQQPALEEYILDGRLVPAFSETPPIRLLYLQTVAGSLYGSRTVLEASNQLTDGLDLLELAGALPTPGTLGYIPPARTFTTAKRRLGLDADEFIQRRPICSRCFKYYPMEDIMAMETPACTQEQCNGIVYKDKRTAENLDNEDMPTKRYPAKTHCYSSLLKTLARFLLRADFVDHLRDTSDDSSRPALSEYELMNDIHDAETWSRLEVGLKRTTYPDGRVEDIEAFHGSRKLLVDCDIGLNMTFNLDWFGITDSRPHSAGAIYGSFNNIHRSMRYLQKNVYLAMTIPGPTEPSLDQMNHLLEPLVDDLKRLYTGFKMQVYQRSLPRQVDVTLPRQVHVMASMQVSDLPASRKIAGAASHSHKKHPCNMCHISKDDINLPSGYDIKHFKLKSDSDHLSHSEKWRAATTETSRKRLFKEHGARFSKMNELPGWLPVSSSPVDFMHNYYGMVNNLWSDVIKDGFLLDSAGWEKYEELINKTIWPSGIGRLPDNLSKNHSLQKADQWRRLCNIQAVILWELWRSADSDTISSTAPDISQRSQPPPFKRDLKAIYNLALWLSVAEHILAAHSVCKADVQRAQRLLQRYCQESLRLRIHLKPNHHMSMHYEDIFRRFGPAYVTWVFAFERFNGELEKVNLNGRAGGEMELTLIRDWILKQRLHEFGLSLPTNVTPKEMALLKRLGIDSSSARGTLENTIAAFQSDTKILKPKPAKCYSNLRKLQDSSIYGLLLAFASRSWPHLDIVDDFTARVGSTPFFAQGSAKSYPFVIKGGVRYGSSTAVRTKADSFACVDCGDGYPIPCKLVYHFDISVGDEAPILCTVLQRCLSDENIPSMPWDLYATDIGSYVVYAEQFGALEVVPTSKISSPVVVIPITSATLPGVPLWAFLLMDRSGIELDEGWLTGLTEAQD